MPTELMTYFPIFKEKDALRRLEVVLKEIFRIKSESLWNNSICWSKSSLFADCHWHVGFDDSKLLFFKLDSHDEWRRLNQDLD